MLSMIHYVVYWYTVKRERDARQTVCVCVYDALVSTTECATHVTEVGCEGEDFSPLYFSASLPFALLVHARTAQERQGPGSRGRGPLCAHIHMCEGVYGGMCDVINMTYKVPAQVTDKSYLAHQNVGRHGVDKKSDRR